MSESSPVAQHCPDYVEKHQGKKPATRQTAIKQATQVMFTKVSLIPKSSDSSFLPHKPGQTRDRTRKNNDEE